MPSSFPPAQITTGYKYFHFVLLLSLDLHRNLVVNSGTPIQSSALRHANGDSSGFIRTKLKPGF